jgi:CMP-N-acetylneuraminic acid synthetase
MYIFSKKDFLQNRNRINKESRPFITPKLESIDIDTEDDWLLSTKLVQNLIK